ncbi:MAG TPA: DsbC family protein [Gammaproteobacteria bacterium]|nr:DsbC family protein [Gammaproteobacteria bacterium]
MKLLKLFACAIALFTSFLVVAEVPKEIDEKIRKNFKKSLPSLKIDTIKSSPIPKLYEITSGPIIMYVTEDAQFAISGDILDLKDGETNVTEEARKAARIHALNQLGEKHMIVYPAGKPKYEVTVFTDLDCVYCRKFHAQMDQLNNMGITVRYVAFPRAGAQSTSFEKAVNVWCAENPQQALTKAKQGQPVPKATCDTHKINEQFHLGALSGISGTPTLILQDGTLVPGFYAADTLLGLLQETTNTKKAHVNKNKKKNS